MRISDWSSDVCSSDLATFSRPPVAIIYIVANLALGLHLFHGAWSMFQSLGLNNPKWNSWRKSFAIGFAALVTVVNIMFPVSVLTGIVDAEDNVDCVMDGDVIVSCTERSEEHTSELQSLMRIQYA